jgi:hypothetical protein
MLRDPLVALALAIALIAVGLVDTGLIESIGLLGVAFAVRAMLVRFVGAVGPTTWERVVAIVVVAGVGWRAATWLPATEWLVVEGMRNAALAMLAVPTTRKVGPVVMGLGLVLVLACSVLGEGIGVLVSAVAYAVVGAAWLARRERETAVPWAAVVGVAVVAGSTALAVHGSVRLETFLPAWVNSSGGDLAGDDAARSGLGDGPDQVMGPDGDAGFDQSDFFCETDGQCLYDAFVEAYGEPVKARVDRTQWLRLNEDQIAEHREQDLRSGREDEANARRFSLRRERPTREVLPEAVVWVEAEPDQYPLRLPVLAFDHYEPGEGHWHEEDDQAVISAMDNADGDGYFRPIDQPVGGAWGRERQVTIRTGTYDANVLPLPGAMTRFRMGHVKRADLFANAAEPMLRVNRTSVPAGSVLEVGYRPAVRSRLADEPLAGASGEMTDHAVAAGLAREWAGHLPRGWQQVDAIIARLREHAEHDRHAASRSAAATDHGHACPVETFLHDTRRGDAHLFASSAVLMLRSLGYDTRLAGGYYVAADTIDEASGQAVVTRHHAHVWPQVRLALEAGYASSRDLSQQGIARGGQWVDLEPTPGFAVADGAPTFAQRAASAWAELVAWVRGQWSALSMVAIAGIGLLMLRVRIIDGLDVLLWRLRPAGDDRAFVLRTLRLFDRRARRRGTPRPPHRSHAAWLGCPDLSPLADWAQFAPVAATPPVAAGPLLRRIPLKPPGVDATDPVSPATAVRP